MTDINYLLNIIQHNSIHTKIISISGESGSGKTTLALHLVASILSQSQPSCTIWIQSSELFPSKRLLTLFQNDLETLSLLEKNIFVTPDKHTFLSYEAQTEFITNLFSNDTVLPPNLKCIVMDNISHHLRYKLSKYSEIKDRTQLLNRFFEDQLFPLICYCQRQSIYLLLIHENSYDPTFKRNRVFSHKLYDKINTISIELSSYWYKYEKRRRLNVYNQNKIKIQSYNYSLSQEGVLLH